MVITVTYNTESKELIVKNGDKVIPDVKCISFYKYSHYNEKGEKEEEGSVRIEAKEDDMEKTLYASQAQITDFLSKNLR